MSLIKISTRFVSRAKQIKKQADRANNYALGAVARDIARFAKKSIRSTKNTPGAVGKNVNTRRERQVKKAIKFWNFRKLLSIVVGPAFSKMGSMMKFHEFGLRRWFQKYPKRPTMGNALKAALPNVKNHFKNSLKRR